MHRPAGSATPGGGTGHRRRYGSGAGNHPGCGASGHPVRIGRCGPDWPR
ncbi:hypothetical protein ACFFX0_27050 [Citricoccus parietis]|uniref:Uncharacterized protein n=1 Tax=Citricoccus parietis TaxID=592307 RepID=A0ABV5G6U2_9MICC